MPPSAALLAPIWMRAVRVCHLFTCLHYLFVIFPESAPATPALAFVPLGSSFSAHNRTADLPFSAAHSQILLLKDLLSNSLSKC